MSTLSRKGERERGETEDPRGSSVIFWVLRSPRLGEHCDEEMDDVECMCPRSDMTIGPALRGASMSTDVRESVAGVFMMLFGPVGHEARKRVGGGWTQRSGSFFR